MKIYVAGKWEERKDVKFLQRQLILLGHEITKDWTVDEEGEAGYPVINVVEDMWGVKSTDIYVGLFLNNHNYKGALVELGGALASRKPCYIIGHAMDSCIFIRHPLVRQVATTGEFLNEMGKG
ncbi:hypothetical protein LCGC14_2897530 [marine sediment metagenome]|uniref:Nucleoside 2-deoxyribosyltransferase n=1 Tax=marine sediment metagenome TaxID=412755 RepID=A0A0F8XVD8_9ZZZZ